MSVVRLTCVALVALAFSCGNEQTTTYPSEITVADHTDTSTSKAGENLFEITMNKLEAGAEGKSSAIYITMPDRPVSETIRAECTLKDLNGNQRWEAGESLTCTEGAASYYDERHKGQTYQVYVDFIDGKNYTRTASSSWTVGDKDE